MSIQTQLDKLLNNIPNTFTKTIGSKVYSFFKTIANEFSLAETSILSVLDQINISTSTGDSLDLHGEAFGVYRFNGESDLTFRSRILSSFIRPQVTKPRIIQAIQDISESEPIIEEFIINRWWLGADRNPTKVTEMISLNNGRFTTSQNIASSGFPDIFPFYDISCSSTNYGSGADVVNNIITPIISLPSTASNFLYKITYTPEITSSIPTSSYDINISSFLGDSTILVEENVHNNVSILWLGESTEPQTIIAPKSYMYEQSFDEISTITSKVSAGYEIDIDWWDQENNHVYSWRTQTDKNKLIRIDEGKRIDSEIRSEKSFSDAVSGLSVDVIFEASNVIGVFLDTDTKQEGVNFFTETISEAVTSINNEYIEVVNNIYEIISIYEYGENASNSNFWDSDIYPGGFFIKNRIYLSKKLKSNNQSLLITYRKSGEIINGNTIILSQAVMPSNGVIVRYRRNPISDYRDISFNNLLYAGHGDNKFRFEAKIQQSGLKWGSGIKWGQGYKWGQFDNISIMTIGNIVDTCKSAGVNATVEVRKPGAVYEESYPYYGDSYFGQYPY